MKLIADQGKPVRATTSPFRTDASDGGWQRPEWAGGFYGLAHGLGGPAVLTPGKSQGQAATGPLLKGLQRLALDWPLSGAAPSADISIIAHD
jgi:hypothetical protein